MNQDSDNMDDPDNQQHQRAEQIERYLRDDMSEEERASFERDMEADPALQEEVEEERTFLYAMDNLHQYDLLQDVSEMDNVLHEVRQTTRVDYNEDNDHAETGGEGTVHWLWGGYKRAVSMAAMLLVLLIPGYFILFHQPPSQRFVNQYYEQPYILSGEDERTVEEKEKQVQSIMTLYEEGSLDKAIAKAGEYLQQHPGEHEVRFYRGTMHIERKNYQDAIADLEIVADEFPAYETKARWYLALAYVGKGDWEQAKAILNKLKEEPSEYQDKAARLLEDLE